MSSDKNKQEENQKKQEAILTNVADRVAIQLKKVALENVAEEIEGIKIIARECTDPKTKVELMETVARIKSYALGQMFAKGSETV
jgi:hypothetical protein